MHFNNLGRIVEYFSKSTEIWWQLGPSRLDGRIMCFHLWNVWQSHTWYRIELIPEGSRGGNNFKVSLLLPSCSERVRINYPAASPLARPMSGPRDCHLVDCDLSLFDLCTLSVQLESELCGVFAVIPPSVNDKSISQSQLREARKNGDLQDEKKKKKKTAKIRIFQVKS